jgi:two-component system, cell cycle response regulator DivK
MTPGQDARSKCAHCGQPMVPGDEGVAVAGELFHVACLQRLLADDTVRSSRALTRRSRQLIARSRRHLRDSRAGRRRRVLIVDDNEDNRDLYAFYLEQQGFHVEVAPDGEAGLQVAQAEHFDVVVMDLSMPKLDGLEATRRLKADARTRNVPVIIVTGHASKQHAEAATAAGAAAFCLKPYPPETLEAEIDRVLQSARSC